MDYELIQKTYDDEKLSWRSVAKKFRTSPHKIWKAIKEGCLISRPLEVTQSISNKHPHSEETKRKISIARKKFLKENPDMVPYKLNHKHKETYPEKYFKEAFGDRFLSQGQVSLYCLDFYDNELQWDIEIDGSQHYVDQRIVEHDIKRNSFLNERGWTVIRINWSVFCTLLKAEKEKIINDLISGKIPESRSISVFYSNGEFVKAYEKGNTPKPKNKPIVSVNNKVSFCKESLYKENICPRCGGIKCKVSKHCEPCAKYFSRIFDRPSKTELEELLKTNSMVRIGKMFGCSDNTIRKWKKYYNL